MAAAAASAARAAHPTTLLTKNEKEKNYVTLTVDSVPVDLAFVNSAFLRTSSSVSNAYPLGVRWVSRV